jgi:hypothetical protein
MNTLEVRHLVDEPATPLVGDLGKNPVSHAFLKTIWCSYMSAITQLSSPVRVIRIKDITRLHIIMF